MENKYTVDDWAIVKDEAKALGLNIVGKSKQVVVDLVNAALEAKALGIKLEDIPSDGSSASEAGSETPAPEVIPEVTKKEVVTLESLGFTEGQKVLITGRLVNGKPNAILVNRYMELTKASPKPGFVNGHLLNKEGKRQKTEIAMPVACLVAQLEEKPEEEAVAQ